MQLVLSVQTQLKSSNVRIRHAAWAALEQLSQDHADHLTIDTMAQQQLLEFLAGLDDPYKSVTSRADKRWSANCWCPSASLPIHNFHLHLQPLLPPSPPTTSTTTSTTTFTYYHNFHHHLQSLPRSLPLSTFTSNHNSHRLHLQPLPLTPTPFYTPFHNSCPHPLPQPPPQLPPPPPPPATTLTFTTCHNRFQPQPPPSPPTTTSTTTFDHGDDDYDLPAAGRSVACACGRCFSLCFALVCVVVCACGWWSWALSWVSRGWRAVAVVRRCHTQLTVVLHLLDAQPRLGV